ncbi:MAG: hypothetical protein WBA45_01760 [Microthrixaceae bacterium]
MAISIATISVIAIRVELDRRRTKSANPVRGDDEAESNYEFMSPAWIAMAEREITNALAESDLDDVEPFTLSEEFTDPPRHLRRDGDTIGFFVRVAQGHVEVGNRPDPNADCRVISDYADALSVARDPESGSAKPAEAERRITDGRLRIEGDPALMPAVLQQLDLHRLLAGQTA